MTQWVHRPALSRRAAANHTVDHSAVFGATLPGVRSVDTNVSAAFSEEVGLSASEEGEHKLTALAARSRDPLAMRRFLEAIAPSVRRVCRSVLGGAHIDLEDVIQDCLIEILRALPKYRGESPIVHYTNRIALRSSIAARKRGRNREQRLRALAAQTGAFVSDGEDGLLLNMRLVRDLIDDLPAAQIEALLMRAVLGYSVEEIAVATQVPVNTAKSRLRIGKDSLRRRLKREAPAGTGEHGT